MQSFADAGLDARLLAALAAQDIDVPVPVQAQAIPPLLEGGDVVMEAPTGSGKTLAFLLPMLERVTGTAPGPRALVVTPTRELAMQVEKVFRSLHPELRCALLYGGVGYATQTQALRAGADVVIGTPGRILDMVERKLVSLTRVEYLVLDEADEMFDVGFAPDVERILAQTWQPQIALASATMPDWVKRMIDRHLREPAWVRVAVTVDNLQLEHGLARVERANKLPTLVRLLRQFEGSAIVFSRTKHGVGKLHGELRRHGLVTVQLRGDLGQTARDRTMAAFRDRRVDVLVATNVAARGLDVSHVGLVINYELPDTPQWLTHRVGRTARMGGRGWALTFVTPEDRLAWNRLRRQGAPALADVDLSHLLDVGEWRYSEEAAGEPAASPQRPPHTHVRPSGGRRRRRGGRRRGAQGAQGGTAPRLTND